jgi:ABC-2 type transport system ATP-binding protein
MRPVEVSHVAKAFGEAQAVADVSFEVEPGEIFGLLGPNGAGKTTTIRLMLDIFRPDRGTVSILDGPMSEEKKNRIGYMPEERGLYQDASLETCLVYLAALKGMPAREARRRLAAYLDRFDLAAHRTQRVRELSKGMQQKAQLVSTILHQPELIIIDEPFAGLDPVNTQLAKDVLQELRQQGAAIIMSTHQMHQVEELCNRIVLIDHGRNVLYGELADIRRRFAGGALLVQAPSALPHLDGVLRVSAHNGAVLLALAPGSSPQDVLAQLVMQRVPVERFEIEVPTLDEIFIQTVSAGTADPIGEGV